MNENLSAVSEEEEEEGEKKEGRVRKQLVPRAKEQVTGSRWMRLVVAAAAKRATPLR